MRTNLIMVAVVCAVLATGCGRAPAPRIQPVPAATPIALNTAVGAPIDVLPVLVTAERNAAREGDLALLGLLWAEDARIVDGRGTADPADDYIWQGRDAILDRYRLAVFPAPPPPFSAPVVLEIENEGAAATAILGVDRWRFIFAEGRWWLQELAY